jgi:two-component system NarL family sensor kinase
MKHLLIFLFLPFFCLAQKQDIINLFDEYYVIEANEPEKGLEMMKNAYQLSMLIRNDSLIARSTNNVGKKLREAKIYDSAKIYTLIALKHAKKVNFYKINAIAYNQLGLIEKEKNNFNQSLNYYLQGIKIAKKHQEYQILSLIYSNIGYLYEIQENIDKAKSYFVLNLNLAKKLNDDYLLYAAYEKMGGFYSNNDKPKAEPFLLKALEKAKLLEDNELIFNANFNLSHYYIDKDNFQSEKAFKHLSDAQNIANLTHDKLKQFYTYFNFGGYYMTAKQYDNAIKSYNYALKLLGKNVPLDQHINFYEALSLIHTKKQNFEKALFYSNKHHQLKDSLFSLEQKKQFETIQTQYEVEKKNNKILKLTKQKVIESKNKWLIFWLAMSLILIGLGVFTVYYFRNKNKALKAEQEKVNLIKDKEIEHIKGVVEGINKERNRLAKDLHDGVAHSLLEINQSLDQSNKTIELSEKISQIYQDIRTISHDLSTHFIKDKNLKELMSYLFNNIKTNTNIETELIIMPLGALDQLTESQKEQLYRIFQELLNNVQKHSKATHLSLNITNINQILTFVLEDDGIGFNFENIKKGIGLENINERINLLNASLEIDSNQYGTTTIINLPL